MCSLIRCNEGTKCGVAAMTLDFKAGEPRIQYKLVNLRKGGKPVEIDGGCEVGADIGAAEENGVVRTGILWVRWSQGDALEASGNARTLNEIE